MQDHYRLSQSPLWALQSRIFQDLGIDAWGRAVMPFAATTTCFVANGYARTIRAFIDDLERAGVRDRPVTIVELGTGHGRFSFMLLKALSEHYGDGLDRVVRYIMTDIAPVCLDAWAAHPSLRPFLDSGVLDTALLDLTCPEEARTQRSGALLRETLAGAPVVVVANFVFDVLPHDLFRVRDGQLWECRVAMQAEAPYQADSAAQSVTLDHDFVPCDAGYYDDPSYNALLALYQSRLTDSIVQVPLYALASVQYFREVAGPCLWLIAEEAATTLAHLDAATPSGLKQNEGAFTMRVNLHAVKSLCAEHGATFLEPTDPDRRFDCYAILETAPGVEFAATRATFHEALAVFGPRAFFRFFVALRRTGVPLSDDAALALMEMSRYDPYIVRRFRSEILEACRIARTFQRQALATALLRVWDNHYPIGEDFKLAFTLGRMLLRLQRPEDARVLLEASLRTEPQKLHETHYYLGRALGALGQSEAAADHFRASLDLGDQYRAVIERLLVATP